MLRNFSFGWMLSVCFLCMACGNDVESIREAAHKYLEARLSGNFELAEAYVSEESLPLLMELADLSEEIGSSIEHELPFNILEVEQKGNAAEVSYQIYGLGEETLQVVLVDHNWEVELSAQSIPDAGLLMMELIHLEQEDNVLIGKEALDAMLIQEELVNEIRATTEI
ncbi:MAG: hypothetical protein AAF399_05195 [Bacteroidota bacterium]